MSYGNVTPGLKTKKKVKGWMRKVPKKRTGKAFLI
jgi:hypothetical protein